MAITIGRHGKGPKDNARYVIEPSTSRRIARCSTLPPVYYASDALGAGARHLPHVPRRTRWRGSARSPSTRPPGACPGRNETIRLSLYVYQSNPTPMQKPAEVVVRKFTFEPRCMDFRGARRGLSLVAASARRLRDALAVSTYRGVRAGSRTRAAHSSFARNGASNAGSLAVSSSLWPRRRMAICGSAPIRG